MAFLLSLLLALGEYVALTWLAPHYVLRAIELAIGGQAIAGATAVAFPSTTILTDLRLVGNTPEASLTIQRAVMRLAWISLRTRTLWFDVLELDRPVVRLTRTQAGTLVWPSVHRPAWTPRVAADATSPRRDSAETPAWRIRIGSFRILDGTLLYLDEKPAMPFQGLLDHLSLEAGPLVVPADQTPTTFAVRGELIGHAGQGAPLYCSGWVGVTTKELEASCKLEPLALGALEPYYHGKSEVRVYATTLQSTSQWVAKANQLDSRIQVELGGLSEGDLSINGRTIVDLKHWLGVSNARLTGEISLTGPLDAPRLWHATLLPGDDQVQQLVKRLLDRGVESLKIPLPGAPMHLSMVPASKAMMSDIEAASKEVHEALEILAFPTVEELPPPAEAASEAAVTPSPEPPPTAAPPAQPADAAPPASDVAAPPVIR